VLFKSLLIKIFSTHTLSILLKGKNLNYLIKRAQSNLNIALRWGRSVGLTFNPLKTAIILFHQKNEINEQELPQIKMGDTSIPYVFRCHHRLKTQLADSPETKN